MWRGAARRAAARRQACFELESLSDECVVEARKTSADEADAPNMRDVKRCSETVHNQVGSAPAGLRTCVSARFC